MAGAAGWPKLPAEAKAELRAARAGGEKVLLKEPPPIPGGCPNCGGLGFVWMQEVKAGPFGEVPATKAVITTCNKRWYAVESRYHICPVCRDPAERRAYLWEQSGLEVEEREWRLEHIEGLAGKEAALTAAREVLALVPRPNGWLTLYGGYGVGKTGILKCVVAACVRAGVSAHYARAEDILREIRSSFGLAAFSEEEIHNRYGRYQVLAIDEVDRTSDTGWARSTLMTLLDTRYTRRTSLATLIATNQSPARMPEALGYLASRMKDGERVKVGGVVLRGRGVVES